MTIPDHPPKDEEVEIALLGPGYGESVVLHVGGGTWIVVDSCGPAGAPAALDYLRNLHLDPARDDSAAPADRSGRFLGNRVLRLGLPSSGLRRLNERAAR